MSTNWDRHNWEFVFSYGNTSTIPLKAGSKEARTTEIFLPNYLFAGEDVKVEVRDGAWRIDQDVSRYLAASNLSRSIRLTFHHL